MSLKNYQLFVKEQLEEIKNKIADSIKDEKDIEIEEKEKSDKNDDIMTNIEKQIEDLEIQKDLISKKIETFNDQLKNTENQEQIDKLKTDVEDLNKELLKFDELINKAKEQKEIIDNEK